MKVRVLYFASLRERAGRAETLEEVAEGTTVGSLWESIQARPGLGPATGIGFAVNGVWCRPDRVLADGDEVGLLPPVSGG